MFPSYSTLKHSENSDGNLMRQNPSMPDFWPWYKKHRYLHQALWVQVQVQLWEENRQDIDTVYTYKSLYSLKGKKIRRRAKVTSDSQGFLTLTRFGRTPSKTSNVVSYKKYNAPDLLNPKKNQFSKIFIFSRYMYFSKKYFCINAKHWIE